MEKKFFHGIYGIVLTPFCEDGSVDLAVLKKQVDETAQNDLLAGFVVCGSTGEFSRLSFEENLAVMRATAEANRGRKQIICGATAGDSRTAASYISEIGQMGADGILLAPPYYFTLKDSEIIAYYEEALKSNAKKLPVIGYNIPQCTNRISLPVFERLLEFEEIKGFKNSWNDLAEITTHIAMIRERRPDVSYFTGLDSCLPGVTALGGDGIFSALSYLAPDVMNHIFKGGASPDTISYTFDLIKLVDLIGKFSFPYGYRVFSEVAGKPLGIGREAVPQEERECAEKHIPLMKKLYKKLTEAQK